MSVMPLEARSGFEEDYASPVIADRLVRKVRELAPLFRSEAAESDRLRAPTPAVHQAFKEHGLLTLMLPQRWGGAGLSMTDYSRVQIEIAKGDMAVSWVSQIINGTTWAGALAGDATQEAMFGEAPKLICGAYNPPGTARKTEGGWIVNGAWPYCSGSFQADWLMGGVFMESEPGLIVPGIHMVYIDMAKTSRRDTWFMAGMQGTGSDTIVAEDVFVPDRLIHTMEKRTPGYVEKGKRYVGAPSDRLPIVPTVRATGLAQMIGGAEAMLEIVEAESRKKPIVTTTYQKRSDSGVILHDLGKVAASIDTARLLLFAATDLLDDVAVHGAPFGDHERSKHKAQCAQIVELIHDAVETMMFISGSSAFSLQNPLSRFWRDMHVGLRHITNIPMLGYEIYGRDRMDVANISPSGAF